MPCRGLLPHRGPIVGEVRKVSLVALPNIRTVLPGNHASQASGGALLTPRQMCAALSATAGFARAPRARPLRHATSRFAFGCGPVLCLRALPDASSCCALPLLAT